MIASGAELTPQYPAMFQVFARNLQDPSLPIVTYTLQTLAIITEELEVGGLQPFQKLLYVTNSPTIHFDDSSMTHPLRVLATRGP